MSTETRHPEYRIPTPEETARVLAEAQAMRARVIADMFRGLAARLRGVARPAPARREA